MAFAAVQHPGSASSPCFHPGNFFGAAKSATPDAARQHPAFVKCNPWMGLETSRPIVQVQRSLRQFSGNPSALGLERTRQALAIAGQILTDAFEFGVPAGAVVVEQEFARFA